MSTIVTRAGKGSPLTHNEVDANFTNLNTDKIQSGNTVAALTITSATISGGSITGITDLSIADGGTGASTAANARTNLGLGTAATTASTDYATAAQGAKADTALQPAAIGTTVQAYDADLTAFAGKTAPSGDVVGTTDTQTLTNKTINASQLVNNSITPTKMANGGAEFGMRNRIINGAMGIWQRGTSGTVGGTYMVDRWYANQSGTAPTWSQLYGTLYAPNLYGLMLTGATGNTGTQVNQRIESINSADLAGNVVTVSGWFYQDTGSSMTANINIYYATVGVDNWTSGITSAGNFNVSIPNNLWTYLSGQITLPSTASQGLQLAISPTALAAGKIFVMSAIQLEKGTTATSFDYRPYGTEFDLCRRYCEVYTQEGFPQQFAPIDVTNRPETTIMYYPKRASPTITVATPTNLNWQTAANTYPAITSYAGTLVGVGLTGSTMFFGTASGVTVNTLSAVGCVGMTGVNAITISAEL